MAPFTKLSPSECLTELLAGRFRSFGRRRIRVELFGGDGCVGKVVVAQRAMNDVYIAESEPYKTLKCVHMNMFASPR